MAFRETTFDHNAILLFGNFSLKRNAPGRSIMVLTTLFECGRESRFDEGEANENGSKSCTVRLSRMSKIMNETCGSLNRAVRRDLSEKM